MKTINKGQLTIISMMVSKLGIDKETKIMMVQGFTIGRETSTTQLTSYEAADMIKHLKSLDPEEKKAERMRGKIISMCHEMGWHLPGTKKVNMARVDQWCLHYSSQKKKLNHHKINELPALVTQFEKGPYFHYFRKS